MVDRFDKIASKSVSPKQTLMYALEEVEMSRRCIAENTGYDKELARQAYEDTVTEVLVPAIKNAFEDIQKARSIESIANFVLKKME